MQHMEGAGRAVDEDAADLLTQSIRILSDHAAGRRVCVLPGCFASYSSYTQRLVGLDRTGRLAHTAEPIRQAVDASLVLIPEAAAVPGPELFDVLNRHQANVYAVLGRGADELASASFVGVFHLFNHACTPNVAFDSIPRCGPIRVASMSRSGSEAGAARAGEVGEADAEEAVEAAALHFALLALVDVEEGTELCISYTSTACGPSERQEHLSEHFGFSCDCERCRCDDPLRELELGEAFDAMRCVNEDCGTGYGVESAAGWRRCVHCGRQWHMDDVDSD